MLTHVGHERSGIQKILETLNISGSGQPSGFTLQKEGSFLFCFGKKFFGIFKQQQVGALFAGKNRLSGPLQRQKGFPGQGQRLASFFLTQKDKLAEIENKNDEERGGHHGDAAEPAFMIRKLRKNANASGRTVFGFDFFFEVDGHIFMRSASFRVVNIPQIQDMTGLLRQVRLEVIFRSDI